MRQIFIDTGAKSVYRSVRMAFNFARIRSNFRDFRGKNTNSQHIEYMRLSLIKALAAAGM